MVVSVNCSVCRSKGEKGQIRRLSFLGKCLASMLAMSARKSTLFSKNGVKLQFMHCRCLQKNSFMAETA